MPPAYAGEFRRTIQAEWLQKHGHTPLEDQLG
jgi:hypothetical protein